MDRLDEIFTGLREFEESGMLDPVITEPEKADSFNGKTQNAHKKQCFDSIKAGLERFCALAPMCRVVGGTAPNTERHAHVSLLVPFPVCIRTDAARQILAYSTVVADDVSFDGAEDGAHLCITFAINDVWEA